jgi:hypothetical protein
MRIIEYLLIMTVDYVVMEKFAIKPAINEFAIAERNKELSFAFFTFRSPESIKARIVSVENSIKPGSKNRRYFSLFLKD